MNTNIQTLKKTSPPVSTQPSPIVAPQIDMGPLATSLAPEAQQFMMPAYSFFSYDMEQQPRTMEQDLKKQPVQQASPNPDSPIKREVEEEEDDEPAYDEDDEPELETPTSIKSPSAAAEALNTCTPDNYSPLVSDIQLGMNFNMGKDFNSTSVTDVFGGFDNFGDLGFDQPYDWAMPTEWAPENFVFQQ